MSSVVHPKFAPITILCLLLGEQLGLLQFGLLAYPSPVQAQSVMSDQNFQRFLVYVDSNNPQTLAQVRYVEPSAYIRYYNGHNVIQSGVFSQQSLAQTQARRLESSGINNVHIVGYTNAGAKNEEPISGNNPVSPNHSQRINPLAYYVIIPSSYRNLPDLGEQIRQRIGQSSIVYLRTQPRGAHVAIGPFSQKLEAEQWNSYLQKAGYHNARVYYGT
jgi:hypothetical protein